MITIHCVLCGRFFSSQEYQAGKPPEGSYEIVKICGYWCTNEGKVFDPPPLELDVTTEVSNPFNFHQVTMYRIAGVELYWAVSKFQFGSPNFNLQAQGVVPKNFSE